jgi:hypothetical protein
MEQKLLDNVIQVLDEINTDANNISCSIKEAPTNIGDYAMTHREIELLVKPLGFRPISFPHKGMQHSQIDYGNFAIEEHRYEVTLVLSELDSVRKAMALTEIISAKMFDVSSEDEQEEGRFYLSQAGEVLFNEDLNVYFRALVFTKPVVRYLGE